MHRLPLVLFLVALPLAAQQHRDFPSISTSGSAEIKVVPDIIEISIGVETSNADLAKAKNENDAAVERIIATAKARNIDAAKIQTGYLTIDPTYRDEGRLRVRSYTVRKTIAIESNDLAGFESLISALIADGANHVNGVQFRTSELRRHRDEARRLAIKAAQEKARLLAEGLGRRVGKAYTISEGADYGGWSSAAAQNTFQVASSGGRGETEGSLAPGRISVTANVSVTFELE